jgi:hypothetical protein
MKILGDPKNADSCRVDGNRMVYFNREKPEESVYDAFPSVSKGLVRPKDEKKIDDF